ncbi:MAG: SDR family oxidoreductase [Edaphocola sp.]
MTDSKTKVAFVTGGTKGIGLGVAMALVAQGIKVAITGRNQELVNTAANKLNEQKGGFAMGLVADVRNYEAQEKAVNEVIGQWGAIDYVIANAGVGHFANIEALTPAQWQETMDTNLTGVFYTTKATLPFLKQSKGYLITIASLAGTNFFANGAAYNASKFGLVGYTQAVMLDLRKHGIKVSTIMPGSVATAFNDHTVSEQDAWKIQPEDIGRIVVDLINMPARTLPSKIEVRPTMPA